MQFQGLGVHPIPEQTIMSGILALLCTGIEAFYKIYIILRVCSFTLFYFQILFLYFFSSLFDCG